MVRECIGFRSCMARILTRGNIIITNLRFTESSPDLTSQTAPPCSTATYFQIFRSTWSNESPTCNISQQTAGITQRFENIDKTRPPKQSRCRRFRVLPPRPLSPSTYSADPPDRFPLRGQSRHGRFRHGHGTRRGRRFWNSRSGASLAPASRSPHPIETPPPPKIPHPRFLTQRPPTQFIGRKHSPPWP
jgi:hypothetical protein